jgi:hypothetical protein
MKAEEIVPTAMPGRSFGQNSHRTHQTSKSTTSDNTAAIDSKILTVPSQERIRLNRLEATNSKAQQIAKQIREVNQSMETIDSHLSEMRAKLEYIVKIYPPYPPGSTERIKALRQFSALRKMIDLVTRPVGDDGATNLLYAADGPVGAADLETPNGENKRYAGHHPLPLHAGPGGLDIPDISDNASDEQISGALDKTIAAQTTLQARHHSILTEANRIISELS